MKSNQRPWKIAVNQDNDCENMGNVFGSIEDNENWHVARMWADVEYGAPQARANAELIVAAVNAWDSEDDLMARIIQLRNKRSK